jgi:hypothetical protein
MGGEILKIQQGMSSTWVVTARQTDGTPFTQFTGDETLAASVRPGQDDPPTFTLTPTWLDASGGTITLPIPGASHTNVPPGRYLLDIYLADKSADLYNGFIEIEWSAGAAASLPVYGSFRDMTDRAPWIEQYQSETDLAGFARQRNQARAWFDDLLQRHYRYSGGLSQDFHFVPGVSFGGCYATYYRDGRRSGDLQGWLDDDRLDVTAQVIDAVSCYAIALVCDREMAPCKDDGPGAFARKFYRRAEEAAGLITAEIDSDDDGVNDLTIRLGISDTLEG